MTKTTAITGNHASSVSAALNKELANKPAVGLIVSKTPGGVQVVTRGEYSEAVITAMSRCGYAFRYVRSTDPHICRYLVVSRTKS